MSNAPSSAGQPGAAVFARAGWRPVAVIVLFWLCLTAGRALGPPDFVDSDHQERQAAYVLDLLRHGHINMQENQVSELAGKPPLYTWLAAVSAPLAGGRLTILGLYAPAALYFLGAVLILYAWGRRVPGRHSPGRSGL